MAAVPTWQEILNRRYKLASPDYKEITGTDASPAPAKWSNPFDGGSARWDGGGAAGSGAPDSPWQNSWAGSQQSRLVNQQAVAESAGLWDDLKTSGTEALGGFLDTAVNILDAPRAASMGLVTGVLNQIGQGLENAGVDNSLDEWTADPSVPALAGDDATSDSFLGNTLGRAWGGITNDKDWGAGDFNGPIKVQESDNGWQRALKLGAAFGLDTVSDPLTYLTFGAAAVGKKAIMEGVEVVARKTAEAVPDAAAKSLAARSVIGREVDDVLKAGDTESAALRLSEWLGREVKPKDAASVLNENGVVRKLAGDTLTDEAATAYYSKSARGLRDYLQTNTDLDGGHAQAFWASLAPGARGGVRLAVPFTGKESGAILSSSLVDRAGLGRAADAAASATLWTRTLPVVNAARKRMSGEASDAWNEWVVNTAKGFNPSYSNYSAFAQTLRAGRAKRVALSVASETAIKQVVDVVSAQGKDSEEAVLNSAERFLSDGVVDVPQNASDIDKAGWATADMIRKVLADRHEQLTDAGLDIGKIADFVPRVMTDEYRLARASKGSPRGGKGTGGSGYDPTKAREAFEKMYGNDEDGKLLFRWQSLNEANTAMTEAGMPAVFETAPLRLIAQYLAATDRLLASTDFSNRMARAGLLVNVPRQTVRSLNPRAVETAVGNARATLDGLKAPVVPAAVDDLFTQAESAVPASSTAQSEYDRMFWGNVNLGSDADNAAVRAAETLADQQLDVDALTGKLAGALSNDGTVLAFLRAAPAGDQVELNAHVGGLVSVIHEVSALRNRRQEQVIANLRAAGKDKTADKLLVEQAKEITDVSVDSLTTKSERQRPAVTAFPTMGRLGNPDSAGKLPDLSGLPASWEDDALIPELVRKTVEQHFTRRVSRKAVDDFYGPLMTLWKMSATVGRGPGYQARNGVGAFWNNLIIGVNGRHYREAARMMKARTAAEKHADGLLSTFEGKSGAWEDAYMAKYAELVGSDSAVAAERAWRESGIGSNNYNIEALGGTLTEAPSSGQLLDNVRRGGKTAWTSGPPVNLSPRASNPDAAWRRAANRLANNPAVKVSSHAANLEEEYFRTAAFLKGIDTYGLDQGWGPASSLVRASQFDYGDLSPFERDTVRLLVPFYTWMRNNVPLQARVLISEPRLPLGAIRLQDGLQDAYGYDYENNPQALPYDELQAAYVRDKRGFAIDPRWVPDMFETGGGPLVLSMENPITDLNTFIPKNPFDVNAWVQKASTQGAGALAPPLKTAASALFQRDLSTGNAFNERGMPATSWAQALGQVPFIGDKLITYDAKADGSVEKRMNPFIGTAVRDLLVPVGIADRLYTGPNANAASQERAASNIASFFGAPLRTATEEQLGGAAKAIADTRQKELDNSLVKLGLDYFALSDYLSQATPESRDAWIASAKSLIMQGHFRLAAPVE